MSWKYCDLPAVTISGSASSGATGQGAEVVADEVDTTRRAEAGLEQLDGDVLAIGQVGADVLDGDVRGAVDHGSDGGDAGDGGGVAPQRQLEVSGREVAEVERGFGLVDSRDGGVGATGAVR